MLVNYFIELDTACHLKVMISVDNMMLISTFDYWQWSHKAIKVTLPCHAPI